MTPTSTVADTESLSGSFSGMWAALGDWWWINGDRQIQPVAGVVQWQLASDVEKDFELGFEIVVSSAMSRWREVLSTQVVGRSDLGRRLRSVRRRIERSGIQLLDWHALEEEVADRRGEVA